MADLVYRQDKTRRIIIDPEGTVGSVETLSGGAGVIIPALASTRVAPEDVESISQSEALDGYAGEVASTRGAAGMGSTIACEVRDYSPSGGGDAIAFPPWAKIALACGFEAAHTGGSKLLVFSPSTQPVSDWGGESAADSPPCSLTVADIMLDQSTSDDPDEAVFMRGATGSLKIMARTNDRLTVEGAFKGLVVANKFLDNDTTDDFSGYGTRATGESVDPLVVKGVTLTAEYRDTSDDSVTLYDLRDFEIDMGAVVERPFDPTATEGYGVAQPYHDTGPSVSFTIADTAAIAEDVMAGYYSGRGFFRIQLAWSLGVGSWTLNVPRIQYDATRQAQGAGRAFAISGKAVRSYAGDSTAPVTISYVYGTP